MFGTLLRRVRRQGGEAWCREPDVAKAAGGQRMSRTSSRLDGAGAGLTTGTESERNPQDYPSRTSPHDSQNQCSSEARGPSRLRGRPQSAHSRALEGTTDAARSAAEASGVMRRYATTRPAVTSQHNTAIEMTRGVSG